MTADDEGEMCFAAAEIERFPADADEVACAGVADVNVPDAIPAAAARRHDHLMSFFNRNLPPSTP